MESADLSACNWYLEQLKQACKSNLLALQFFLNKVVFSARLPLGPIDSVVAAKLKNKQALRNRGVIPGNVYYRRSSKQSNIK
jgi:hypothetical protein